MSAAPQRQPEGAYYSLRRKRPVVSKIRLEYPILVCGEEVSELWLTRPTLGDMRGIEDSGSVDMILTMLPSLAAVSVSEAESIDVADLPALAEVIGGFLPASLTSEDGTGSA